MDTRTCKYCGIEFNKFKVGQFVGEDIDGTFNDGYCCKFHRKDHEKQLIKEGKMESIQEFVAKLNIGMSVWKDSSLRDKKGNPIWFPKDDRPYFDRSLQRTFKSKKEKKAYMDKNNLIMDGSFNQKKLPIEAGDTRSRSFRKQNRMED